MKTNLLSSLFLAAAALFAQSAHPVETYPDRGKFLFWAPQEKPFGFRHTDKIFSGHVVPRGPKVKPLAYAPHELDVHYEYQGSPWNTTRFMEANNVAGLLVLDHGRIALERYALGFEQSDRWTSFSVAKSVTSTLVGAALQDGKIAGVDDPVTRYLPGLKDSAYDGVTIRNMLNMASGLKWNEDYADPKSDVNMFSRATDQSRGSTLVTYMSRLPRDVPPGTKFHYNSAETNLVGELVMAATGKPLATYLSEKIWSKLGAEQDAFWMVDADDKEMGGCCLSLTLRDYARFAQFILDGGAIAGKPVVGPGWIGQATRPSPFSLNQGFGYAYFWWTAPSDSFYAVGIFGQQIYFFPADKLAIVTLSAWPSAVDRDRSQVRAAYLNAVRDRLAAARN